MLNPDKSYNKKLTSIGLTFMQPNKKIKSLREIVAVKIVSMQRHL